MKERERSPGHGMAPDRLDPAPVAPSLPGTVVLRPSLDEAIDALAAEVLVHAFNCVRAFGDFHLALSGEEALEPVYMRLMYDPAHREFPWKRTHLWLVEERCVPETDERRAWPRVRETIVEHSDIPHVQAHPIEAEAPDAPARYERALHEALGWREKGHDRLDCVVLAVAGSGVWSAPAPVEPPGGGRRGEQAGLVERVPGGTGAPGAVAMTERLVNAARLVAIFGAGEAARGAVEASLTTGRDGGGARPRLAGLAPVGGALRWHIDHGACPK